MYNPIISTAEGAKYYNCLVANIHRPHEHTTVTNNGQNGGFLNIMNCHAIASYTISKYAVNSLMLVV
jgi:hypothetical protein